MRKSFCILKLFVKESIGVRFQKILDRSTSKGRSKKRSHRAKRRRRRRKSLFNAKNKENKDNNKMNTSLNSSFYLSGKINMLDTSFNNWFGIGVKWKDVKIKFCVYIKLSKWVFLISILWRWSTGQNTLLFKINKLTTAKNRWKVKD